MSSCVNVSGVLKAPGQEVPYRVDVVIEAMDVLGDPVAFTDVSAEGVLVGAGDTVNVTGTARANVTSRCARCLEEVHLSMSAPLDANFAREPDPDDPDQYRFEGYEIDLTEAVKDALVLELPFRFLCREGCKGLCPKCGTNLNTGSCMCPKEDDENPFAVLRSIVQENEEV